MGMMFLAGGSTRSLSMLSKRLLRRLVSSTEISNADADRNQSVEKWRRSDFSQESVNYLFIDGVNFRVRIGRDVELTLPLQS